MAIRVMAGAPAPINWPASVLKSVTRPRPGATTRVWDGDLWAGDGGTAAARYTTDAAGTVRSLADRVGADKSKVWKSDRPVPLSAREPM